MNSAAGSGANTGRALNQDAVRVPPPRRRQGPGSGVRGEQAEGDGQQTTAVLNQRHVIRTAAQNNRRRQAERDESDFDENSLSPELRERLIYDPYRGLNTRESIKKYFTSTNVLLNVSNFTVLSSYLSHFVFLCLFTAISYSASPDYALLDYAVGLDIFLNGVNVWLHIKSSDTLSIWLHEFVPPLARALGLAAFLVFRYIEPRENAFFYISAVYVLSIFYRFGNCVRYSKTRLTSVETSNSGSIRGDAFYYLLPRM